MAFARTFFITATVVATASLAFAGSHGGNPAVKARQSHMQLYQHNVAILFGMVKGSIEYDADAASAAANNLATLSSSINQRSYWTPGTSNAELGDETNALPASRLAPPCFNFRVLEPVIIKYLLESPMSL